MRIRWQKTRDKHVSMTNNYLTKQTRFLCTEQFPKKIRGIFLPEEKRAIKAIKKRISNSINVYYISDIKFELLADGDKTECILGMIFVTWCIV